MSRRNNPRMNTETTMCGACSFPSGPGTRPGLMVVKRKVPSRAVGTRPQPRKPGSTFFACVSSGCAYLPWAFACQSSSIASGTPCPSASSTRPLISTRSPETPGPARLSTKSRSRPMRKKGPTVCEVVACRLMSFLPRRGVTPAQDNVEPVPKGMFRHSGFPVEHGDEPVACFFVRRAVEDGVKRQKRVAGKIHLGDQSGDKGGTEERKVNVRGAPGVVMVLPGVLSGTNGHESIVAIRIRQRVAASGEIRVQRGIVLVHFVKVPARRVGLPEFDQCVGHRATIFVKHATTNDDALPERFAMMLACEVTRFSIEYRGVKQRSRYFGERMREIDQGSRRRAFDA